MDLNPDEVRIKQEMADACEQVFGIFDGTKWHRSALLAFVPVDDLAGIITDSSAPAEEVEAWRAAGVDVITVDPGPREPLPLRPRDLRRAVRNDEQVELMTVMAAVDLGAQSGRVAARTFRRRAAGGPEAHRFAERAGRAGGSLQLGYRRSRTAKCSTVCAPAAARHDVDSVARRLVGGRLRAARRGRPSRSEPRALSRRAARRGRAGVFARMPARELYERTGIQLMPINTVFELAAMAASTTRHSRPPRRCCSIPDLFTTGCAAAHDRVHERDDDPVFRPRAGGWATDLLERLDIPPSCSRRRRPGTPLGPSSPTSPRRLDSTRATSIAVATHDTGSAVAAVPFTTRLGFPQCRHVVARRGRGRRAADQRRHVHANLTNEGGVAGHVPAAPQRHRSVAVARVPARLGGSGAGATRSTELVELAEAAPPLRSFDRPG